MRYLNVIGVDDAAGALAGITSTIFAISDMKKRREFEQKIALLSTQQQQQLNYDILHANTQTDRLAILTNGINDYSAEIGKTSINSKTTLIIVAAGMAGILLIAGILLTVKKKK